MTERDAVTILQAERELEVLRITLEHCGLSDVAAERCEIALQTVRAGLAVARSVAGLSAKVAAA